MKTKIKKTPELIWVANYSEHVPLEVTLPTPSISIPLGTLRKTYKEEIERIQKLFPGRKLRIKKRLVIPPKKTPNHVSDLTGHLNMMEPVLGISPEQSLIVSNCDAMKSTLDCINRCRKLFQESITLLEKSNAKYKVRNVK